MQEKAVETNKQKKERREKPHMRGGLPSESYLPTQISFVLLVDAVIAGGTANEGSDEKMFDSLLFNIVL
jgi:hypothetical protein